MILCGTGHRPNKLGGYGPEIKDKLLVLAESCLIKLKSDIVISGVALGWDTALALASINLNIPFVAAVPFNGQESRWPEDSQKEYQYLISKSQRVHIVSPGGYSAKKMQIRNEWMIDHSDEVLALYDGESLGGTKNCLDYAMKKDKKIHNVWEIWHKRLLTNDSF